MKEGIPDAPQLQEALAKRWSDMLDFSEFDRPDEPGSWNLVYSLHGIQKVCRALLDGQLPKLVSASGEEELRDALREVGLELSHLLYHIHDARYFDGSLPNEQAVDRAP